MSCGSGASTPAWGSITYAAPSLLDRNLFRPYWLLPRHQYATVITSGFLHADLPHLLFNGFTFWAFGFGLERLAIISMNLPDIRLVWSSDPRGWGRGASCTRRPTVRDRA